MAKLGLLLAGACALSLSQGAGAVPAGDQKGIEAAFDAGVSAARPARLAEADVLRAQPCRLAARQGQCRVHAGAVQGMGLGRADRDLRGALSDADLDHASRLVAPDRIVARWPGAAMPGDDTSATPTARCRLMSPTRATAMSRRRRLRELRHARRLQGARAARHRREGQDRHRPLRRRLARPQAEAGAGAWRGRLHHLFRSARGRLSPRATSIPRAARGPIAGVQRGSVVDMPLYPGDPLTPGDRCDRRMPSGSTREDATTILKIPVLPISYGDAQQVAARARRAGRPRRLARRPADHLSYRRRRTR